MGDIFYKSINTKYIKILQTYDVILYEKLLRDMGYSSDHPGFFLLKSWDNYRTAIW